MDKAFDPQTHTVTQGVPEADPATIDCAAFQMSKEGFADFLDVVAQEGKAVPRLVDVLRRPAPWGTVENDNPSA